MIRIKKWFNHWADPLLILVLALFTYLPHVTGLGYYRDDWHVAWGGMLWGPTKIFDLHLTDRPFMGLIYSLTYAILGDAPLAQLRRIRRLPMLIIQGRQSVEYPPDVTQDELRLFHAAGLHVTVRQYPCGDELTTKMLHDMHVWMMEQMQGEAAVCGAA